ncbi:MAG TPA: outer membrane protein assembly factor BamD [Desulfuromonadales bacterium]|nr:outer membrane protein assembly factor BamD [Desulfuromonadales bacterium]
MIPSTRKYTVLFLFIAALLQGCATTQTPKTSDALYKEGEQLFQKGNYSEAITQWKKVKESYQSPELSTQAEIGIANAYFLNKEYIESAVAYEDFRKLHPKHPQAGLALFRQGMSYFNQFTGIDTDQTPTKNALAMFDSYQKLYPTGDLLVDAQIKIIECREKLLQYELYVGNFYLKTKAYKAAIGRFEDALKSYTGTTRRDEILYLLGRSYIEDGQTAKGREILTQLTREFPGSTYTSPARKVMN